MRIVITGGAGYIGSTLVRFLLEDGVFVISIDNLSRSNYQHLKNIVMNRNLVLIVGDVREEGNLKKIYKDSDVIVHLAAIPGLKLCEEKSEEAISTNVYATKKVLDTARKMDVEKVIFSSSGSVYGKPINIPINEKHPLKPLNLYGVTKLAGEKLMEAYHENYGLETVILRFGNIFGVGLFTRWENVIPKFVKQGLEGKPLTIYGDGKSSRDFVHVEDAVQAMVLAIKKERIGGEIFNVGGETIEIQNLAEIVSEEIGKAIRMKPKIVYLPSRSCETKKFSYNYEKIKKMLGYRPRWTVKEGVKQLINYKLRKNIRKSKNKVF